MAAEAAPADTVETMQPVKVAVIDLGSSSARLLVASVRREGEVKQPRRERTYLRLGDDAYRLGRIGDAKLEEAAVVARRYARIARKREVERLVTTVTAPGRQASNAAELLAVVATATAGPVELLSAEEEARLAWAGAVAGMERTAGPVAVVDLAAAPARSRPGRPAEARTGCARETRARCGSPATSSAEARLPSAQRGAPER